MLKSKKPRIIHMAFTQEMADLLGVELDEILYYHSGNTIYINTRHWSL
jgi:hypothetical protein